MASLILDFSLGFHDWSPRWPILHPIDLRKFQLEEFRSLKEGALKCIAKHSKKNKFKKNSSICMLYFKTSDHPSQIHSPYLCTWQCPLHRWFKHTLLPPDLSPLPSTSAPYYADHHSSFVFKLDPFAHCPDSIQERAQRCPSIREAQVRCKHVMLHGSFISF